MSASSQLHGECDLLCIPDLDRAIRAGLGLQLRRFVVDLSAASLLDCAAWGTLLEALWPSAQSPGGGLVACGARDRVARFLSVLPPERTVGLYETRRAAIVHLTEAGTSASVATSDLVGSALEEQRLAAFGLEPAWARNGLLTIRLENDLLRRVARVSRPDERRHSRRGATPSSPSQPTSRAGHRRLRADVAEIGRADDEELEALGPCLVASPRTGRDAHRVPLLSATISSSSFIRPLPRTTT